MTAFTSLVVFSLLPVLLIGLSLPRTECGCVLPVLSSQLCMDLFSFLPLPSARIAMSSVSESNIPSLVCCWWGTVLLSGAQYYH